MTTPETLRERVARALAIVDGEIPPEFVAERALRFYGEPADAAIAAMPRLSAEARETILRLIGSAIDAAVRDRRSYDPAYLAVRAELERLP